MSTKALSGCALVSLLFVAAVVCGICWPEPTIVTLGVMSVACAASLVVAR